MKLYISDQGDQGDDAKENEETLANPWPKLDDIFPSDSSNVTSPIMDSIDCRPPDGVNFEQTRLVNFVDDSTKARTIIA